MMMVMSANPSVCRSAGQSDRRIQKYCGRKWISSRPFRQSVGLQARRPSPSGCVLCHLSLHSLLFLRLRSLSIPLSLLSLRLSSLSPSLLSLPSAILLLSSLSLLSLFSFSPPTRSPRSSPASVFSSRRLSPPMFHSRRLSHCLFMFHFFL